MLGHATPLMAQLAMNGKIPGLNPRDLVRVAVDATKAGADLSATPFRMPAVYCQYLRVPFGCDGVPCTIPHHHPDPVPCGTQLVREWFAINPITDLTLACMFCAIVAERRGAEVHTLIEVT